MAEIEFPQSLIDAASLLYEEGYETAVMAVLIDFCMNQDDEQDAAENNLTGYFGFRDWFGQQFGKRLNAMPNTSDEELRQMVSNGQMAQRLLHERNVYDVCEDAALKAWSVKDESKYSK